MQINLLRSEMAKLKQAPKDMAATLNINYFTLMQKLGGRVKMDLDTASKIAKYLNLTDEQTIQIFFK